MDNTTNQHAIISYNTQIYIVIFQSGYVSIAIGLGLQIVEHLIDGAANDMLVIAGDNR